MWCIVGVGCCLLVGVESSRFVGIISFCLLLIALWERCF
jgi:hypothetical protein